MKKFKGLLRFKLEPGANLDEFAGRLKALIDEGKEKMQEHGLIDAIVWRPGEMTESEFDLDVEFLWQSKEHRDKLQELRGSGAPGMEQFVLILKDPVVSARAWGQYIEY